MAKQTTPVTRESFILSLSPSPTLDDLAKTVRDIIQVFERIQEDLDTIIGRRGLPTHYNVLDMNGNPITNATSINVSTEYEVAGKRVVTAQQPAISPLTLSGGVANDNVARVGVNAILTLLQAHGLMA